MSIWNIFKKSYEILSIDEIRKKIKSGSSLDDLLAKAELPPEQDNKEIERRAETAKKANSIGTNLPLEQGFFTKNCADPYILSGYFSKIKQMLDNLPKNKEERFEKLADAQVLLWYIKFLWKKHNASFNDITSSNPAMEDKSDYSEFATKVYNGILSTYVKEQLDKLGTELYQSPLKYLSSKYVVKDIKRRIVEGGKEKSVENAPEQSVGTVQEQAAGVTLEQKVETVQPGGFFEDTCVERFRITEEEMDQLVTSADTKISDNENTPKEISISNTENTPKERYSLITKIAKYTAITASIAAFLVSAYFLSRHDKKSIEKQQKPSIELKIDNNDDMKEFVQITRGLENPTVVFGKIPEYRPTIKENADGTRDITVYTASKGFKELPRNVYLETPGSARDAEGRHEVQKGEIKMYQENGAIYAYITFKNIGSKRFRIFSTDGSGTALGGYHYNLSR